LLEKYQSDNRKLEKDIPVLKEVVEGIWRKEPELKVLKDELVKLNREIQLSLTPISGSGGELKTNPDYGVSGIPAEEGTALNQYTSMPGRIGEVKGMIGDRLMLASGVGNQPKAEMKEAPKGLKI
jgi:hypothetical protein